MPINPVTKQLIGFIFLLLICPSMPLGASDGSNYYVPSGASEASGSFRLVWEGTSHPIRNKSLTWSLSPNNGTATLSGSSGTDNDGRASFTLFFNANACGTYTIKIRLSGDPRPSSFDSFSITYGESCPTVPSSSITSSSSNGETADSNTSPPTVPSSGTSSSSSGTTSPPPTSKLVKISHDNQVTTPGDSLIFIVELRDSDGSPIPDVDLNFFIFSGDKSRASLSPVTAMTDSNGRAQTTLSFGIDAAGIYIVEAYRNDKSTVYTVFTVTVDPLLRKATRLEKIFGDNQTGLTGDVLANPFVVKVRDQYNTPLTGTTVTFTVLTGGGTLSDTTSTTDANGQAASTLSLGAAPGTNTVEVSAAGISETVTFTAEAIPPTLTSASGNNQIATTGTALANPFVVEVRDGNGNALPGIAVTFVVLTGGGTLSDTTSTTDADGQAASTLSLGAAPGTNTVEVSAAGISETVTFTAEAIPPTLTSVSGNNQMSATGTALANPFVVEVRDGNGNPLAGFAVTFVVLTGGGTLSTETMTTGANGQAASTLSLGAAPGTNTVEVSAAGISETVTFTSEGIPPTLTSVSGNNQMATTGTTLTNPFVVEVRDGNGNPLAGVAVAFAVLAGGGALSNTTSITDASGQATSTLILGSDPGTNIVEVSAEGVSETITFTAEGIPPTLTSVSGNNQMATTGTALANPFVVEVRDGNGNPLAGVVVTFAVLTGGGTLNNPTSITDANGQATSTLILGADPGTNTVEGRVEGIIEIVTFSAIAELLEFDLSLSAGLNLIHLPLKVRTVDGMPAHIQSVSDLYDALGGADTVNWLITLNPQTQEWDGYFGDADRGTGTDSGLTDQTGILVNMLIPASVRLGGDALGTDGSTTIILNQGLNLVGLPLRDSRVKRVSDLFALDGIGGNVSVIILTDNGEFKMIGRAGDPGDTAITGGQSFILTAQRAATVDISGEAWSNTAAMGAAPRVSLKSIDVGNMTPVLVLRGTIVDNTMGLNEVGFRVTVKNLSTGRADAVTTTPDAAGYRFTVVDIKAGRAAMIGDTLEISAQSPHPFIGVKPLRYTVTAEDMKRNLIQLPKLVTYEIPAKTELLQNYPNPFNPETWIPYQLSGNSPVSVSIYDSTGACWFVHFRSVCSPQAFITVGSVPLIGMAATMPVNASRADSIFTS